MEGKREKKFRQDHKCTQNLSWGFDCKLDMFITVLCFDALDWIGNSNRRQLRGETYLPLPEANCSGNISQRQRQDLVKMSPGHRDLVHARKARTLIWQCSWGCEESNPGWK